MRLRLWTGCALVVALASCGGGGGSGSSPSPSPPGPPPSTNDRVSLRAIAATAPVPSYANTDLEFDITNPSTVTASNVNLTVTLGSGLTRAGLQCTASNGGTCPADPDALTGASLISGGMVSYRMSVIVPAGASGQITSTASVTATGDTITSNNSASIAITAYTADISIVGSTSATNLLSGATIPYSFTVTNSGPDIAQNLVLESSLSTGQALASLACTAGGGATCPGTGPYMNVPTMPSGGSLTFALTAQLATDALVSVSGSLAATSVGDGNFTNNRAVVTAQTRIPTSSNTPSFIKLQSDTGDWVGAGYWDGRNYSYTNADAQFEVYEAQGFLHVNVFGDERWQSSYYMPAGVAQVMPGTYVDPKGAPFHDPSTGGMTWWGEGRACSVHTDVFTVDNVVYIAGEIAELDIRFEQHCNGLTPALRGQIHWVAGDSTLPPGPVNPPPAGLWQPAAGATPPSGNYLYFQSDPQDFVGEGLTKTYTQVNSVIHVDQSGASIGIGASGDEGFGASFRPMSPLTQLAPGYYAEVVPAMGGNPARGGMSVGFKSHGCNTITGWFVIDSISFSTTGELTGLDARFEQHCEGATPAIRGKIHWRSDDPTQPPGPVVPPPAGLWSPPANDIPATGNFVYIQSEGEFIGQGLTRLYTPLDSIIEIGGGGMTTAGNRFQLDVTGDESWTGFFQAMNTLPDLRPGYYGDLLRFPMNNPAKGGLSWYGEGRGCNELSGWFVIDEVTYSGSTLQSITLRFEQHCEFATPALRGMIRWSADDTRQPAPPQNPPPAILWDAPDGATPASGNYVYLQSEAGDFVGQGQNYLYTPLDARLRMNVTGRFLEVETSGDKRWVGGFQPMMPFTELQPGYYYLPNGGSLARGSFGWHGDGRGCGGSLGWFVVDAVTYSAGSLTSLDLRFEQRCNPAEPALRGKIHWRSDDTAQPPGPVNPPPAGLWSPPANSIPASGNFFYVEGDPYDYITRGFPTNYTPADGEFQSATFENELIVGVSTLSQNNVSIILDRMYSIPRLQPGYYPEVQRTFLHNPAVAGLEFTGSGRSCELVDGWFLIHSITYTGDTVTAIDVTFEQFCNGTTGASARGRVRWSQ